MNLIDFLQLVGVGAGILAALSGVVAWYTAIVRGNVSRQRDLDRLFENHRKFIEKLEKIQEALDALKEALKENTQSTRQIQRDLDETRTILKIQEIQSGKYTGK